MSDSGEEVLQRSALLASYLYLSEKEIGVSQFSDLYTEKRDILGNVIITLFEIDCAGLYGLWKCNKLQKLSLSKYFLHFIIHFHHCFVSFSFIH